MKEVLISTYQSMAPAAILLGGAAFAASFALNNTIAHIRTHLYESEAYAGIAKRLQSIDPEADAVRPLRVLMTLTMTIRFFSPVMVLYVATVPKTYLWTVIFGFMIVLAWLVCLVLWLWSIRQHQKYEVQMTTEKLNRQRESANIDSGLGVS